MLFDQLKYFRNLISHFWRGKDFRSPANSRWSEELYSELLMLSWTTMKCFQNAVSSVMFGYDKEKILRCPKLQQAEGWNEEIREVNQLTTAGQNQQKTAYTFQLLVTLWITSTWSHDYPERTVQLPTTHGHRPQDPLLLAYPLSSQTVAHNRSWGTNASSLWTLHLSQDWLPLTFSHPLCL